MCFAHVSACIWFFIGSVGEEDGLSWINDPSGKYGGIVDEHSSLQYIASIYFIVSTLASVGFGDITAQTQSEMAYAIALMLAGATMFSYITAIISSVMTDFDQKATMFRAKMSNLIQFVRKSSLSPRLQAKLLNEMGFVWRSLPYLEEVSALRDEMPKRLLLQVSLEMHASLLDMSTFFRLFEDNSAEYRFIGELVSSLVPKTNFESEFIATVGEPVKFWAIVKAGSVVALSPLDATVELMVWMPGTKIISFKDHILQRLYLIT